MVPYDPKIGATLSSHEVAQGYREVEDPSVTVRFRLAGEPDTAFLVWTTTPWTLPSNLLLAVGADIDYAFVEHFDETLIVASAQIERHFTGTPHKVLRTVKGAQLVGTRYQRLFDFLEVEHGDPFRVVEADFVSTEDGTGIVHTAPAYGVDDLALGAREGLPVVHGVGLDGCFNDQVEPVKGLFFKDADPVICSLLEKRGQMFKNETVLHNYPFGWRTGDPLIYYAKEAWYIRTTQIKDRLVALNQTINWVPETIRTGRFGKWLENNIDWALSRERFWGTPLPVWTDGEGEYICIGSLSELEALTGESLAGKDLHRPAIDEISFSRDGKQFRRVPEVIDCWFDSGAMTYAQWHYPFENQDIFESHFPADYICEAIDQTRGWFYTLHAIAALVDDSVAFRNCVCLSHIVDGNGKKMSKSQGNIVDPNDVFDTVGVDALRWLFLARTAPDVQKRISVDIVREVAASFVNTVWNTYAFFVLYAQLDKVDMEKSVPPQNRPEIDRWALALAHETISTATAAMDAYDAYSCGQAIENFVNQLSNWYVRRNRRRFWKSEEGDDKQAAYLTLFECLDILQKLIAPFMPFLAEKMYLNLSRCMQVPAESVHLSAWPAPDKGLQNDALVYEMNVVQTIVGLGRSAREQSRVRVRQPLSRILVNCNSTRAREAMDKHASQILDELNVKHIEYIDSTDDIVQFTPKPVFSRLGKRYGKLMPAIKDALEQSDAREIADKVDRLEPVKLVIKVEDKVTAKQSPTNNPLASFVLSNYVTMSREEEITLEPQDIRIETTAAEGFTSAGNADYLVALDTRLDHALVVEGVARELVRSVQDARKSAGLQISDRIILAVSGSEPVAEALDRYRDYIMNETLAIELCDPFEDGFQKERSTDTCQWKISLKAT